MPETLQSQSQSLLQNLTGVQTGAQPAAGTGAVNNGNPGTVYNIAPQGDAWGNWWQPAAQPINPLVSSILNATYTPRPYTPPPVIPGGGGGGGTGGGGTGGGGTTPPPVVRPPTIETGPVGRHPQALAAEHDPYGDGIGGMCVCSDSHMPGDVMAIHATKGEQFPCHLPEEGFHNWPLKAKGTSTLVDCVKIITDGGAVWRGAASTPFTFVNADGDLKDGQWALAPNMLNHKVWVLTKDKGNISQTVIYVEDIGKQWVVPLSFGGRSFAAGDTPDALIYSHNMIKDNVGFNASDVTVYGMLGSDGMLSGMIDQSRSPYNQGQNFGIPLPGSGDGSLSFVPGTSDYFGNATPGISTSNSTNFNPLPTINESGGDLNGLERFVNYIANKIDPGYTGDPDGINWSGDNSLGVPNDSTSWMQFILNALFPGAGSLIPDSTNDGGN